MVIVIDDFAVDSNTVQPKAKPAVPPVTPLYDDNTMYNATVYPDKQVSAPSAAEQPVAYQAPIWESATQTYRDPASGLLWLDDGTPGGKWVTDREYRGLPNSEPFAAVTNAAKDAINFANRTTGMTWDTAPIAQKYNVAPEVFPDFGNVAPGNVYPAPPPPVSPSEDSYDFYRNQDWNTDSDAYWQTYNPGKWEDSSASWWEGTNKQIFDTPAIYRLPSGETVFGSPPRSFYSDEEKSRVARDRDLIYGDILREQGGQGVIEPASESLNTSRWSVGDYYNYTDPVRTYWNQKAVDTVPSYTSEAKQAFLANTPTHIGSMIPETRPSEFGDTSSTGGWFGGYEDGSGYMALRSPFVQASPYIHERGHHWQNLTMGWDPNSPENKAFMDSVKQALADPSLPDWLRYAIESGNQHGTNTGLPLLEIYATIAQVAPNRMNEIPPYLRRFFDTLYTR